MSNMVDNEDNTNTNTNTNANGNTNNTNTNTNNIELVDIYFGPLLGHLDVYQFNAITFHENTLSINSKTTDNTGSRFYSGSHLACRFITLYPELFEQKRVCEIGCGVGMVGVCTALCTKVKSIMLTDGNQESLDIAILNIKKYNLEHQISTHILEWGVEKYSEYSNNNIDASGSNNDTNSNISGTDTMLDTSGSHIYNSMPYDIVIGCELMYFKLDMEQMLTTIRALLVGHSLYYNNQPNGEVNNNNESNININGYGNSMSNPTPTSGLMIHSHLFRVYEHQQLFISLLSEFQWETIEIEPKLIINEEELKTNPHW